ncbi:MAG: hypothetical protein GY794_20435 [bacterium]|nr:hypothetical protein [bacterium]
MAYQPAGKEANSGAGAPVYQRHRPERTLLVQEYYPAFKARLAAQGTALPRYVERELDDYLKCGQLEPGFLRVRCDTCHSEHLVAFSWPLMHFLAPAALVVPCTSQTTLLLSLIAMER